MLAHKVSCLLPKGLTAAKTVTHARSLSAIAAATPSPLSPSSSQTQLQKQPQAHNSNSNYHCTRIRTYVSRAHPEPIPEFSVPTGLQMVLDGTEERKKLRAKKWERNKDKRRSKGIEVSELRFCGIYFGVRRGKRNRVDWLGHSLVTVTSIGCGVLCVGQYCMSDCKPNRNRLCIFLLLWRCAFSVPTFANTSWILFQKSNDMPQLKCNGIIRPKPNLRQYTYTSI